MIIPNRLNIRFFLTFLVVGLLCLPLPDYGLRVAMAALVLAVTFGLNAIGLMGGGDAKYLAAVAPYIAPADWFLYVQFVAFLGIGALLAHMLARRVPALRNLAPHWLSWQKKGKVSYALALGGATVWYLVLKVMESAAGTG
jgi:prepilin peptidase CpaA